MFLVKTNYLEFKTICLKFVSLLSSVSGFVDFVYFMGKLVY